MRFPGRKLFRRALRPLARTLAPGAVVLGYHRVADATWDPLGLAVSPSFFAEQVDVLRRLRRIVSLGTLARLQAQGEPLERYAALTFDDGYEDFAMTVLPVIEAHAVPATVFVATGFTGRTFWWDEVTALLKPGGGVGEGLVVQRDGGAAWQYEDLSRPENRAAAARDICDRLACADRDDISDVLRQLRAAAATAEPPACAAMSHAALEAVAGRPLVEIGAHTASHGCLASLPEAGQEIEIGRSKRAIEALPGVSATVFSYPNGSFSARTPALVRALGFSCACTSREGIFNRHTDAYRIPRIWAPNAPAPIFRRWLGNWIAGLH